MTLVKVCGITNSADALAAVRAGAQALGFNFYAKSPRYISPADARLITSQLPAEILKVGVFVNETPARLESIAEEAGLDVVQLHGDESPEHLPRGLRVWKAYRVNPEFSMDWLETFPAEAFLLDSPSEVYGGSGHTFDWTKAQTSGGNRRRILLAGGLDDSNVGRAIAAVRPWGVDACSRLESAPGIKDHAKMARFIEAVLATT